MTHRTSGRTSARWLVAGLALFALAACGSDKTSGGSATTTSAAAVTTTATTTSSAGASTTATGGDNAALCTARDNLRKSLDEMKSADVLKNGVEGLQTAVAQVKTDLQAVKSAASADLQPQVKAFEDSLSQLETALKDASSGNLSGVVTAATATVSSGATLLGSLQSLQCG